MKKQGLLSLLKLNLSKAKKGPFEQSKLQREKKRQAIRQADGRTGLGTER